MSKIKNRFLVGTVAAFAVAGSGALFAPAALADEAAPATSTTPAASSESSTPSESAEKPAEEKAKESKGDIDIDFDKVAEDLEKKEEKKDEATAKPEEAKPGETPASKPAESKPADKEKKGDVSIDFDKVWTGIKDKHDKAKAQYEEAKASCQAKADKLMREGNNPALAAKALLSCSFKANLDNKSIDDQIDYYNKHAATYQKLVDELADEEAVLDPQAVPNAKRWWEIQKNDCMNYADKLLTAGTNNKLAGSALLVCGLIPNVDAKSPAEQLRVYRERAEKLQAIKQQLVDALGWTSAKGEPLSYDDTLCTLDSTDPNCAWAHGEPLFIDDTEEGCGCDAGAPEEQCKDKKAKKAAKKTVKKAALAKTGSAAGVSGLAAALAVVAGGALVVARRREI